MTFQATLPLPLRENQYFRSIHTKEKQFISYKLINTITSSNFSTNSSHSSGVPIEILRQ